MKHTLTVLTTVLLSPFAMAQMGPGHHGHGSHHQPHGQPATSAVFTNFGTPCGADLNGTVGPALEIGLDVTNAAPSAMGMVFAGDQATTPWPLPWSTCTLLLDHGHIRWGRMFMTDANGAASVVLTNSPPAGLTVSFQALVMTHGSMPHSMNLDASNGTELVTQ